MMGPENFERFDDYLAAIAAQLDRYVDVPDDVLEDIVGRHGSCMWVKTDSDIPEWTGDDLTDRQLAARICAGCTAQLECLELELRQAGPNTVGVWGALPEQDRRALYLMWRNRREGDAGGDLT